MYTIEQAEERFRENLRNLIGEWKTEENFYENLICSFDSEYLDKNGNSPDYSDYAVETGDFRNVPYSCAQTLEVLQISFTSLIFPLLFDARIIFVILISIPQAHCIIHSFSAAMSPLATCRMEQQEIYQLNSEINYIA